MQMKPAPAILGCEPIAFSWIPLHCLSFATHVPIALAETVCPTAHLLASPGARLIEHCIVTHGPAPRGLTR